MPPTVQKAAGALLLELKKNHLFRDDFQPGDSLRLGLTGPTGLFLAARRRFGQAVLTARRAVIHYRLFSPYRPPKAKKNHLFRDDFQPGDSLRLGLTGSTGLFLAARRRFGQAVLTARRAVIHYRLFSPYRPPKAKKNHLFRDDFQPGDSLRLGLTGPTGLFLAARRRFGQAALTARRAVIHYRLFSPYRPPKAKKIISFEMTSSRATNSGLAWWGR